MPIGREQRQVPSGAVARQGLGNQLSGDGGQADAHHAMSGRQRQVGPPLCPADVGEAIRGNRPQSEPGLDALEIALLESGKIPGYRFDEIGRASCRERVLYTV